MLPVTEPYPETFEVVPVVGEAVESVAGELAGLAVVPSELAESGAGTGAPKGAVSRAVSAAAKATALYRAYTATFWNKSQTLGWM